MSARRLSARRRGGNHAGAPCALTPQPAGCSPLGRRRARRWGGLGAREQERCKGREGSVRARTEVVADQAARRGCVPHADFKVQGAGSQQAGVARVKGDLEAE